MVYVTESYTRYTLLYTWNWNNILNQLYFNNKKERNTWCDNLTILKEKFPKLELLNNHVVIYW